ncbi:MAG: thioredoxin domain-containing protein [Betaproteobacteria bacterium]|nr:thioredoxin domain-containing protein [Betaproteobacteria bacterium]
MPNRLARETSPYLQQHADNPVDWHPWGPEALEKARSEDKPILLSVGYSACHWCHVMAHESFEDAEVAAVMNRLFVNVKVDREERPDIDQIYQTAHQMLAQKVGGWPLTMFLAPDGTPYFAGTYFPRESRYGLPGFAELCERMAAVWRERRAEVDAQGEQVRIAFARLESRLAGGGARAADFDAAPIEELLANLREQFDEEYGGFGPAPKFPHPTDLDLCLRRYVAVGDGSGLAMADLTLTRMCEGGIYDHLGGGFCRYSTDAAWSIPHFEKMLYDNGPLLALLADAWRVTAKPLYARAAAETAAWVMREMQSPEGGYFSSLDADSEGEEGRFYVWARDEARALIGEDYAVFAARYGLDEEPNFEERLWHLRLAPGAGDSPPDAQTQARIEAARACLLAARERRVRPGRDEKILVSWNALMVRGMARAGRAFGRADWVASAQRAMDFIRARMWKDGRLLATYKDGRAHLNAYLDDYAFLIDAALELLQGAFDAELLAFAQDLADALLEQFEDAEAGGFWFTGRDHERLVHRPKPGQDNATPAGNGVAAYALQRLAALSGEERYRYAAERALELYYPTMREYPAGFASLATALEEALSPPATVILRGEPEDLADWSAVLAREYWPATLVLAIPAGALALPPVLDKPVEKDVPVNAWVCQGVTCLAPSRELDVLRRTCAQGAFR